MVWVVFCIILIFAFRYTRRHVRTWTLLALSLQEIQQAMMDYQSNSNGFENASKWYSQIGLPLTGADKRRR